MGAVMESRNLLERRCRRPRDSEEALYSNPGLKEDFSRGSQNPVKPTNPTRQSKQGRGERVSTLKTESKMRPMRKT